MGHGRGPLRWRWLSLGAGVSLIGGIALAAAWFGLRLRPVDLHRLRTQAAAAVKAGRYEEAEAALARIPTKRPLDWVLQSKIDLSRGRPEAALADLAHVPDSDGWAALARYSEGFLLLRKLHRARAAEAALRRALELDPKSLPARQELSYLYYILSMKAEFAAQFRVLESLGKLTFDDVYHACVLVRAGAETRQIIEELKAILTADPADHRARLALAEELRRLNRVREAQLVLADLPESDPQGRALRARLALDRGDLPGAAAILAAGPQDDPDCAPLRGWLALAQRDTRAAVREYRIAVAARPDRREALLGLGRALRLAGDPRAAEPYLKAAADCDRLELLIQDLATPGATTDARRLHELGTACERLHRYPEARAWFSLAYSYHSTPETWSALTRLAHRDADPDAGLGLGPGEPDSIPQTQNNARPAATDFPRRASDTGAGRFNP